MRLDEGSQAEILATFRVELEEHCQALSHAFLALEKEPEPDERGRLLDAAFRSAHNLKGAARAVALGTAEALAHGLESILGAIRRDELELGPVVFDLLYATVDTLGNTITGEGAPAAPDARLSSLIERLAAVQAPHLTAAPVSAVSTPAVRDLPPPSTDAGRPAPARRADGGAYGRVTPSARGTAETIRLPAARLDTLLEQLGELVLPRLELEDGLAELAAVRDEVEAWQREWRRVSPQLRQLERDGTLTSLRPLARFLERSRTRLGTLAPRLSAVELRLAGPTAQLGTVTDDLQAGVKRFRMLPFGQLEGSLERAVRDLTRSLGKEARLVVIGSDTEVDRRALEDVKDPLLHLLRNALDHGIESPAERQRLGKPSIGSVVVTAAQHGNSIVIEVEDDGAGIAVAAIRRAASERGMATEAELAVMPDAEALRLIFRPGLSTRSAVDELSGRGVGLDVVASNVERLDGRVDVESTPGRGTRFVIVLPLMVATTRALVLEAGGGVYALPTASVERVLRPERLGRVGGRLTFEHEGSAVPVVSLATLLGASAEPSRGDPGAAPTLALIAAGAQRVAIGIDRVVGEQEIVVKPLPFPVLRVRHIAGATILGSGRVVPILNVADLVRAAAMAGPLLAPVRPSEPDPRRLRVLVADDSLTTRTLERYILEAAGYEVELAGDGAEALALLHERGCDVLVSDIDMPGIDGIALTAQVRAEPKLRDVPVILVTSLESADDRERGLQAGADAYIVKSSFDQDQLLRTIREFV